MTSTVLASLARRSPRAQYCINCRSPRSREFIQYWARGLRSDMSPEHCTGQMAAAEVTRPWITIFDWAALSGSSQRVGPALPGEPTNCRQHARTTRADCIHKHGGDNPLTSTIQDQSPSRARGFDCIRWTPLFRPPAEISGCAPGSIRVYQSMPGFREYPGTLAGAQPAQNPRSHPPTPPPDPPWGGGGKGTRTEKSSGSTIEHP